MPRLAEVRVSRTLASTSVGTALSVLASNAERPVHERTLRGAIVQGTRQRGWRTVDGQVGGDRFMAESGERRADPRACSRKVDSPH